jgi:hypothetical protein
MSRSVCCSLVGTGAGAAVGALGAGMGADAGGMFNGTLLAQAASSAIGSRAKRGARAVMRRRKT